MFITIVNLPLLCSVTPDPCVRMIPTNKAIDLAMQTPTTTTDRLRALSKTRDYVGKIPKWRTPLPPVWETPVREAIH